MINKSYTTSTGYINHVHHRVTRKPDMIGAMALMLTGSATALIPSAVNLLAAFVAYSR